MNHKCSVFSSGINIYNYINKKYIIINLTMQQLAGSQLFVTLPKMSAVSVFFGGFFLVSVLKHF